LIEIAGRAILFDMDGTLVDSTACVEQIWSQWGRDHGIALADILAVSHGRLTRDTIAQIAPHLDAQAEATKLDLEGVFRGEGIVPLEGARRLLNTLQPQEWAVVTSAPRELAMARLSFAGLPQPAVLVGSEDVRAGKPDPDGFLKAASLLGVPPSTCTVIEDTPAGVLAARAAGMRVIAIGTTFPVQELLGAQWVRDFSGVSFRYAGAC